MTNETVNYDTKTKAYVLILAGRVIMKGRSSERISEAVVRRPQVTCS